LNSFYSTGMMNVNSIQNDYINSLYSLLNQKGFGNSFVNEN
jgi:hypothetical protein